MKPILLALTLAACGAVNQGSVPAGAPDGPIGPQPDGAAEASSVPSDPLSYTADQVFTVDGNYLVVPSGYDATNQTPMGLLVWLHGCGGYASGDIYMTSPVLDGGAQNWITMAVGGAEGTCWDPDHDMAKVSAALASIETHFNIARKRVVLGGYSSGGDLGYRMIFDHAELFAGLLAENTSPFRDTGATQAQSLAAATWKINIVHLAHLEDTTYPIDGVRTETDAVIAAGFPLTRIERHGDHYDDATAALPGTDADFQTYLLPELGAGWLAP